MDGNKLFSELRSSESWDSLVPRVQAFLSPVLSVNEGASSLAQFELFSLKVLRLCTERFPKLSSNEQRSTTCTLAFTCIDNLLVTSGKSGKAPKLGFEKILLHFCSACFVSHLHDEGEKACESLFVHLNKNEKPSTDEANLYKHTHDIIWKAAINVEKCSERVLQLRKLALKCLLASDKTNLSLVIDKALKTDQLYTKSARQQTNSTDLDTSHYCALYELHTGVFPIDSPLLEARSCLDFVSVCQYALSLVKVCALAGHGEEAKMIVNRVGDSVRGHRCGKCLKGDIEVVRHHVNAMCVWVELDGPNWLSDQTRPIFDDLITGLQMLPSYKLTPPYLLKLIESLELVILCILTPHRETLILECSSEKSGLYEQLKSLLGSTVTLLDMFLKNPPKSHPPTLHQKGRKRQLQLLHFHGDILVDLLTSKIELEGSRSSRCAPVPLSPTPKKLASSFFPVLKQSQKILEKAGDSLDVSEHRWLGTDAYNIGLALLDHGKLEEACDVLSLSLEELIVWVKDGRSGDQQVSRAGEIHLLRILLRLTDVQRKIHGSEVVMTTIVHSLSSLPPSLLSTSDCVHMLVGQWVKAKRELISLQETGATPSEMIGWTVVHGADGLCDGVRKLFLECEMRISKASSLPSSAILPSVDLLLSLLSHTSTSDGILERAKLIVEKAVLLRGGGPTLSLLEEASLMLEPLSGVCAYEQLAITHLWKAICVGEQQIGSCDPSDGSLTSANDRDKPRDELEIENEITLSHDEEELMMSDDITQCLHSSVDYWTKLTEETSDKNILPLTDPVLTFQYLSLTAQLSLAHSQYVLAARSLKALLELTPLVSDSVPAQTFYLSALSSYCDLLHYLGGQPDQHITLLKDIQAWSLPVRDDLNKKDSLEWTVAWLTCQLSLARIKLHTGQIDCSREILLSVLRDSCLKKTCSLTFDLVAKSKFLLSDILLHRTFDLKTSRDFFTSFENKSSSTNESDELSLTPLELTIDGCRLFTNLADHKKVIDQQQTCIEHNDPNDALIEPTSQSTGQGTKSNPETTPTFSSSVGAWQILVDVLESLRSVSRLYLSQGNLRKAHSKAREGAMLARRILLQGWYVEFLLLLAEIQTVWGSHDLSLIHSRQTAILLDCTAVSMLTSQEGNKGKEKECPENDRTEDDFEMTESSISNADVSLISIDSTATDESIIPSLGQGQGQFSPLSHPLQCTCTLCTSIVSNPQVGQLVALTCSNLLDKVLLNTEPTKQDVQSTTEMLIQVLLQVKQFLTKRKLKSDATIKDLIRPKIDRGRKVSKKALHSVSTSFTIAQFELSLAIGNCHLALLQPGCVIDHIESSLLELGLPSSSKALNTNTCSRHRLSLQLARAQYTLGVARLQDIESTHPDVAKKIWSNVSSSCDKENVSAVVEVKRSTRSTRPRKTRTSQTKVLSEINTPSNKDNSTSKHTSLSMLLTKPLDHLSLACQLSLFLGDAHLVRNSCRWLSVLVSTEDVRLSCLLLSESMQVSLTHQATLTLGTKLRRQCSKTPLHHASEAINTLTPHTITHSHPSPLHKARQTLLTSSPPSLPHTWTVVTISPSPSTHHTHPTHLIISRTTYNDPSKVKKKIRGVATKPTSPKHINYDFVKVVMPTGQDVNNFLNEFSDIQVRSKASFAPCEIRKWWAARRKLDKEMNALFDKFETDYLGPHVSLLSPPTDDPLILVLGEKIQALPWESLSMLSGKVVSRMPSLRFMDAHRHMLDHNGSISIDRQSTFYVLNPQGDLLKTESVFADWFSMQDGWEGVVGRVPSDQEFTAALQDKDLYVYCGHSFGNFLTSSSFQQLSCRSTALLIGCGSGLLKEKGKSDPHGIALNFLVSGCPSVVGCLWDVTDGDIDRFSRALLKATTSTNVFLSTMISSSRPSCRLPWLTGAAPIVYGVPVTFRN